MEFQIDRNEFAGVAGESNLNKSSQEFWHFRLGHLNFDDMKKLVNRNIVDGLDKLKIDVKEKFCECCVLLKQTKLPFPKWNKVRSQRVLQLIHSDVCGPFPDAHDGSKYFVTFIDDFSRASMVYCIGRKSETFNKFKEFVAMSEALHGCKVAKLRADNGGEYISNEFKDYCKEKGIQLNYTVPYNPQMNSIAERLNRTLQERMRAMLNASGLDDRFWSEAILSANYIRNRCPTSAVGKQFENKTPAEIWFKNKLI